MKTIPTLLKAVFIFGCILITNALQGQDNKKGNMVGKITIHEDRTVTLDSNFLIKNSYKPEQFNNYTKQICRDVKRNDDLVKNTKYSSRTSKAKENNNPIISSLSTNNIEVDDGSKFSSNVTTNDISSNYLLDYIKTTNETSICSNESTQYLKSNFNNNDLVAPNLTHVSANSTLTVSGTNVSIGITVINNGNATAGSSEVGYYLSSNTSWSTSYDYLIGTDYVTSLTAGSTSNESISVDVATVSPTIPAGTYYIFYCIDHLYAVTESNESDNFWYFTNIQVTIPSGAPNLTHVSSNSTLTVTGTNVSIGITVKNTGTTTAGSSEVGYYLSSNTYWSTSDYLIGTDYVPSLAVNSTSNESISVDVATVTPTIPPGTYYIFYCIDHLYEVTEYNESDNFWYFTSLQVTIPSGAPNLTHVSSNSTLTVTGTNVSIGITVKNTGTATAGSSEVGYYLSSNTSWSSSDYLIGTDAVSSLTPNSTSNESISVDVATVTPTIPPGTYYIFYCIDHLYQVSESNENDNFWYFTDLQVIISGLPNLTHVAANSSLTISGTNVSISITVINNGNATAGSSEVGYYLSSNTTWSSSDYLIGTDAVPSLTANSTSNESISVDVATITPTIPPGTYYIFYCIDHLHTVTESNESDNCYYFTNLQVTIPGQPNLTHVSANSTLTVSGTSVSIGITVKNTGTTTAGSSEVGYYLSSNTSWSSIDYLIGIDAVSSLTPNSTSNESISVDVATVTPTIPPGTYYVFYCIDHLYQVSESNESDNFWYFTNLQVTIQNYGDINVTPTSLTITQPSSMNINNSSIPNTENINQENNLQEIADETTHGKGCLIPDSIVEYFKNHPPLLNYNSENLLTSVDWSGNDSPVKNQLGCGSCWAFAATAYIENLGLQTDLSEQVVLSCSNGGSCTGGYFTDALQYFQSTGVPQESCYPYIESNGDCDDKCSNPPFVEKITTLTGYLWGLATVSNLKAELNSGPLVVRMLAPIGWSYSGGVYDYSGGEIPESQGHAVLLVGYDDANSCFKAKNSWGASWGENGYFRIAYDDVTDDVHFGSYAAKGSGVFTQQLTNNSFAIQNVGVGPLTITSISDNATWLTTTCATIPFTIDPGASQSLIVNINWSSVNPPQQTATITILSNDPDEPSVTVTVTVIPTSNPIISGTITNASGTPISGVSVTFSGTGGGTVTTNSSGFYTKTVTSGYSGTATPSKTCYSFSPPSRTYTNLSSNQVNQDYTGSSISYTVSGYVRNASGNGISGVTVTFSGSGGGTCTTNSSGLYSLSVPCGYSGTATPSKTCYYFTPPSRTYNNLSANQNNQDFIGTASTYIVSGYTRDGSGNGIEGVLISFSSNGGTTSTNQNGYYSITLPCSYSGIATPSKTCYSFTPPSRTYSNLSSDQANQDYVGSITTTYSVSGYTRDVNGNGISGVTLTFSSGGGTTSSNANGYFSQILPCGYDGTITPFKTCVDFAPASRAIINLSGNLTNQDFTGSSPTYSISGHCRDGNGLGISGVSVSFSGNGGGSVITNGTGFYSYAIPCGYSGQAVATKTNYSFTPPNIPFSNVTSNLINQDFVGTTQGYTINGNLNYFNANLTPLGNTVINLKDASNNIIGTSTTNSTGSFNFTNINNGIYKLEPIINKPWGGVTAIDVNMLTNYILGTNPNLAGLQLWCGDINQSNSVSAVDINYIRNRILGVISSFPCGDFIVNYPTPYNTVGITVNNANVTQNIQTLCFGDANKSYTPASKIEFPSVYIPSSDNIYINGNEDFVIPLKVTNKASIAAVTMDIFYDAEYEMVEIKPSQGNPDDLRYIILNDRIKLIYATSNPLNLLPNEVLFNISCRLKNNSKELLNTNPIIEITAEFGDPEYQVIDNLWLTSPTLLQDFNLSINEINDKIIFELYPNPFSQELNISYSLPDKNEILIRLEDITGKVIDEHFLGIQLEGNHNYSMETTTFANGIYIVKLIAVGKNTVAQYIQKAILNK
jgi:hypothetical protein